MALIYIAEDDNNIREIEGYALKSGGYEVRCYADAKGFGKGLRERLPDLVLLGSSREEEGLFVLKCLRNDPLTKELPIIFLTVKPQAGRPGREELGADDYIAKPFGIMELVSRVQAVLRRENPSGGEVLSFGPVLLDQARHICRVNGETAVLTFKEYELMKLFLLHVGTVLTREMLVRTLSDDSFAGDVCTVDVQIKALRKKLGEIGKHIVTVRNVGYKLA